MLQRLGFLVVAIALVACALPATALAAPPANDNFEQAVPLSPPPSSVTGTVAEATRQPGEPQHGGHPTPNTVWYSFAPSANQRVAVSTCGVDFDSVIAVYTGTEVGALRQVTFNDDACGVGSRVSFSAAAGQTYRVAVASLGGLEGPSTGAFELKVEIAVRPPNDAFADAQRMRSPGAFAGSTIEATRELGERRHQDDATGKSVWYSFRTTRTQTVVLDTNGSTFDTVLAVYRGRRVNRLRRIAQDDDSGEESTSRIRLRARRGVTYYVAVDGCCEASGDYILNYSDGGVRGTGLTFSVEEGQTLSGAIERGLRASVGCRRPCRVRLEALVGRRTARDLRLRRRVVASARGSLGGSAEERSATLRFDSRAARALRGRQQVALTVRATLLGTQARDRSVSVRITLSG